MIRMSRWPIAALFFALCMTVLADDAEDREALRFAIEQLRESGRLSIGGIDVASGHLLADFYERRGFSPAWSGTGKIESLLEVIRATSHDGLDPTDYHLETIEQVNGLLENGKQLAPDERAELDIRAAPAVAIKP